MTEKEESNRKKLPWFTLSKNTFLEKISIINSILKISKKDKNPGRKEELKQGRKNLRFAKCNTKNKCMEEKCDNIEQIQKSNPQQPWQNIKYLLKGLFDLHSNKIIKNVKTKKTGLLTKADKETAMVFKANFTALYHKKRSKI